MLFSPENCVRLQLEQFRSSHLLREHESALRQIAAKERAEARALDSSRIKAAAIVAGVNAAFAETVARLQVIIEFLKIEMVSHYFNFEETRIRQF